MSEPGETTTTTYEVLNLKANLNNKKLLIEMRTIY